MHWEHLKPTVHWLKRVVTQPRDELDRWQGAMRVGYDLMRFGGEQLRQDRASQMAAAMAFHTLFALLPMLVVTTIVVKSVRGTDALLQLARDIFNSAGWDDIHFVRQSSDGSATAQTVTLAEWFEGLLNQAVGVNLSAVGWIGFAAIIYGAISLIVTIENSFNTVFQVAEGRKWARRIPIYWFLLTVSPVAVAVGWYANQSIVDFMANVSWWRNWTPVVTLLWNTLVTWILLVLAYILVPHTTVILRPAFLGALVAAIMLQVARRFLGVYLENAFAMSHLYGSLGLIPMFMLWVFVIWLIVLFGLELSATIQKMRGRRIEEMRHAQVPSLGMFDPISVIAATEVVARRFAAGQSATAQQIADESALPESIVGLILPQLLTAGIIHRLESEAPTYALAKPPDQISAEQLLNVGFELVEHEPSPQQTSLLTKLRDSQLQLLSGDSLKSLMTTR